LHQAPVSRSFGDQMVDATLEAVRDAALWFEPGTGEARATQMGGADLPGAYPAGV